MIETKIYFSYHNNYELEKIVKYINTQLKAYTLYKAIGCYEGLNEPSRIIEILNEGNSIKLELLYRHIAYQIKKIANQESVLITTKNLNMEFI